MLHSDMAEGEIVGLLDHDDTLEPNALYEVVKALQDKDVDVVYTDEDKNIRTRLEKC